MLVKLILISAICSFVYVRSVQSSGETQYLSLIDEPRSDTGMDAESTKTEERRVRQVPTTLKPAGGTLPQVPDSIPVMNHESAHLGAKHPKKRAMNYKEDHQIDLRPGCCG